MTEQHRNQLIDDIIETQPQLGSFLRPLSDDLTAGSWDQRSYSFRRGFELLWDHATAVSSGVLNWPMLSLWRQSVELALKASITEISGALSRQFGHDLKALFAELLRVRAALGYCDDDDLARDVTAMIDLVQGLDPFADLFRYPQSRKGDVFGGITVDLDALFQAHWIIVTWCEGAAMEAREDRSVG